MSSDFENPYASSRQSEQTDANRQLRVEGVNEPGLTGHVMVVGILMIVQGVMEFVMAGFLVGYALFMPQLLEEMAKQPGPKPEIPPEMEDLLPLIMGGLAVLMAVISLMTIVGGIQVMRFRWRGFGIFALISGLGTLCSCYCLPTAAALAVYGLVVLFNKPVISAFAFGRQGFPAARIRRAFAQLPYDSELLNEMKDGTDMGF